MKIDAIIANAVAASRKELSSPARPVGAFNAFSLLQWLTVCAEAGVPAVPGRQVASLPMGVVTRYDSGDPAVNAELRLFYGVCEDALHQSPGSMLRWDACASHELKAAMALAQQPELDELPNIATDPQAFHRIAHEYGEPLIPMVSRPWVPAKSWQGYPVEYRAFVWDGEVAGVSSYYPQRPLAHPAVLMQTYAVRRHAQALCWALAMREVWWCHNERFEAPLRPCFAADFLVAKDGTVLFLAGGPPHIPGQTWGADPCCFPPGDTAGIALALEPPNDPD